jgi:YD repeat-containing protein
VINEMTYTPRGWLASRKQYPNGNMAAAVTTNFTYTAYGAVSRITQPDGSYLQYSYDQAHRLIGIADNLSNAMSYTLDNAGNRIAEATKDPANVIKRSLTRQTINSLACSNCWIRSRVFRSSLTMPMAIK